MKGDPFSNVFRAKRADRVKLIFWDGNGMCLFGWRPEPSAGRTFRTVSCGSSPPSWTRLASRACDRGPGADPAELNCGTVNRRDQEARHLSRPVIHSRHDDVRGARCTPLASRTFDGGKWRGKVSELGSRLTVCVILK